jgi:protein gp37
MVKSAPTSIDVCFEPIIVHLQGIKLNAITWGAVIRDSEVSIRPIWIAMCCEAIRRIEDYVNHNNGYVTLHIIFEEAGEG